MPSVIVQVELYPGVTTGLELEELSSFVGWVAATSITELTPGRYTAVVTDASNHLRARWLYSGGSSRWVTPISSAPGDGSPTPAQEARLAQAAIAKATRFLVLPEAPLGSWGELTEFGVAILRPDYAISELLYGMHFRDLIIDWGSIVTPDDVIRVGLQADPADLPAERLPDVERALEAAEEWIEEELSGGFGIA